MYTHKVTVIHDPKSASSKLPWVHILIANVKGTLRGVHHGVPPKNPQGYLSEFCWRFSRRGFTDELFDRLLYTCIKGELLTWSALAPCVQLKLVKIGAKVICHSRMTIFQMAKVAVPENLFQMMLSRIHRLVRACQRAPTLSF